MAYNLEREKVFDLLSKLSYFCKVKISTKSFVNNKLRLCD